MNTTIEIPTNTGNILVVLGFVYLISSINPVVGDNAKYGDFAFNIMLPGGFFSLFFKTEADAIMQRARMAQAISDFKSLMSAENIKEALGGGQP